MAVSVLAERHSLAMIISEAIHATLTLSATVMGTVRTEWDVAGPGVGRRRVVASRTTWVVACVGGRT